MEGKIWHNDKKAQKHSVYDGERGQAMIAGWGGGRDRWL